MESDRAREWAMTSRPREELALDLRMAFDSSALLTTSLQSVIDFLTPANARNVRGCFVNSTATEDEWLAFEEDYNVRPSDLFALDSDSDAFERFQRAVARCEDADRPELPPANISLVLQDIASALKQTAADVCRISDKMGLALTFIECSLFDPSDPNGKRFFSVLFGPDRNCIDQYRIRMQSNLDYASFADRPNLPLIPDRRLYDKDCCCWLRHADLKPTAGCSNVDQWSGFVGSYSTDDTLEYDPESKSIENAVKTYFDDVLDGAFWGTSAAFDTAVLATLPRPVGTLRNAEDAVKGGGIFLYGVRKEPPADCDPATGRRLSDQERADLWTKEVGQPLANAVSNLFAKAMLKASYAEHDLQEIRINAARIAGHQGGALIRLLVGSDDISLKPRDKQLLVHLKNLFDLWVNTDIQVDTNVHESADASSFREAESLDDKHFVHWLMGSAMEQARERAKYKMKLDDQLVARKMLSFGQLKTDAVLDEIGFDLEGQVPSWVRKRGFVYCFHHAVWQAAFHAFRAYCFGGRRPNLRLLFTSDRLVVWNRPENGPPENPRPATNDGQFFSFLQQRLNKDLDRELFRIEGPYFDADGWITTIYYGGGQQP